MRTFAAIYLSVADDKDFLSLHYREQHMYWTLLRQVKLNRAGLLDLNIYKWANAAGGMSEEHVVESLMILAERKYIVVDPRTREVLVRTYVRGDGAYKMPRVMASVVSAARQIESPLLRRALLAEVDRIPLDELSDEPAKGGGPSIRARVLEYVMQLRKFLGDGSPDDPSGRDTSDDTLTVAKLRAIAGLPDTPADTHSDTPGYTQSQHSGGYAGARVVPSPTPVPTPVPKSLPSETPLASVTLLPLAAEPVTANEPDALFECAPAARGSELVQQQPTLNSQTLIAEWVDHRARSGEENKPTEEMIKRAGRELKKLLAQIPYEVVRQGFMEWDAKSGSPTAIPSFVNQVQGRRAAAASGSNVVVLHQGRQIPGQRVSATRRAVDEAEAAGEEAKRMLAAMRANGGSPYPQIGSGA